MQETVKKSQKIIMENWWFWKNKEDKSGKSKSPVSNAFIEYFMNLNYHDLIYGDWHKWTHMMEWKVIPKHYPRKENKKSESRWWKPINCFE